MTFVLGLAFLAYLIVITAGCSVLARRLGWVALVMPLMVAGLIAAVDRQPAAVGASAGALLAGVTGVALGVEARKAERGQAA